MAFNVKKSKQKQHPSPTRVLPVAAYILNSSLLIT
jgi:hypothetical protein